MVNPAVCMRSRLVLEMRFPVAKKCSIFFPILVY
jgi:hypothetical protein